MYSLYSKQDKWDMQRSVVCAHKPNLLKMGLMCRMSIYVHQIIGLVIVDKIVLFVCSTDLTTYIDMLLYVCTCVRAVNHDWLTEQLF